MGFFFLWKVKARKEQHSKMSWTQILSAMLTLFLYLDTVQNRSLSSVYWNITNPIFKTNNNDHIIDVREGDNLDFICPYYWNGRRAAIAERYHVYQVEEVEYESCNVPVSSSPKLILSCDKPDIYRDYSLAFQEVSSNPFQTFKIGNSYYFIALYPDTTYGGPCLNDYMKVKINFREKGREITEGSAKYTPEDDEDVEWRTTDTEKSFDGPYDFNENNGRKTVRDKTGNEASGSSSGHRSSSQNRTTFQLPVLLTLLLISLLTR